MLSAEAFADNTDTADIAADIQLQQILHLSCQVHKLLWIDWMLSTNQIDQSDV